MSTVSIDHIAMPTSNAEKLIEFYKRLGFHPIGEVFLDAGLEHQTMEMTL